MYKVDLNCDLGESFGAYTIGKDSDVIPLISSANVACGFHAGDPCVMSRTVKLCKDNNVAIGAHTGFRDLEGFGRRNMSVSAEEAKSMTLYQIGALDAFCKAIGTTLSHVKPHGALYNIAAKDQNLARAICEAVYQYDPSLTIVGLAGSRMIEQARLMGLSYASEVFADRAYEDDGSLVSRSKPNSMITDEDEAVERVITMIKEHTVKTVSGKTIEITPDTVCVHGDSDHALQFVSKIRQRLLIEKIEVLPLKNY